MGGAGEWEELENWRRWRMVVAGENGSRWRNGRRWRMVVAGEMGGAGEW